jgi:DNA mismatch repair protein MutL
VTIKTLPARLANQIAAGEVVERPASVIKELVENSLDAGATRIDIDIEKGGSKLIRVRDNGKGIVKDELGLALSRHATSKIHTLDDLEAIMSLGFRGEALASISSVSRLTLTSRTAAQEQAWSAYSEGREMQVKLQPAAHPVGSTVEVLDLFFNTPARRKFLRTDKTEFTHIDELLKRIALSRFDVTINLRHNGKTIRQYRAAKTELQQEKRLAAVCGAPFVRNMLRVELEHNGLKLFGWITTPEGARQQSDLQYCYVNGRMMRDKLINHAIRQSYETSLRPEQFATYVLFIELDPHQVDVNVHPAKHEVRFHQARLVHDFIYQALTDALAQSLHIAPPQQTDSAYHSGSREPGTSVTLGESPVSYASTATSTSAVPEPAVAETQIMQAVARTPAYPGQQGYQKPPRQADNVNVGYMPQEQTPDSASSWQESAKPQAKGGSKQREPERAPSRAEVKAYRELLSTPDLSDSRHPESGPRAESPAQTSQETRQQVTGSAARPSILKKGLAVVEGHHLLMQADAGVVLVSLARAEWYRVLGQLQTDKQPLIAQPLLVPLALKLAPEQVAAAQQNQALLERFAIQLKSRNSASLLVMAVPQPLRQQNLQHLVPDLLSYAVQQSAPLNEQQLAHWLSMQITSVKSDYTLSEGIALVAELEQVWHGVLPLSDHNFVQLVDFTATIARLN